MTKYQEIKIKGLAAEQVVGGVLRGGHILSGKFYFTTNNGIQEVDAGQYNLV